MGKVIARTGIKKKKGYLYYLDKNGNVAETKMAQFDDGSRHHSSAMDGLAGREAIDIFVEKTHNGTLLSTIYRDQRYKQLYQGYTLAEAKKNFRVYVKNEDGQIFRNQDRLAGPARKPAKKAPAKKAAKKAVVKKANPARKATAKKGKTGLIQVPQSAQGRAMDKRLKAKTPGRRVSASGRKYNERRSNRAD